MECERQSGHCEDDAVPAENKSLKVEVVELEIVQEIMKRDTESVRRIIGAAVGKGGVTVSYLCPHWDSFPLENYVWWVSGRKERDNWWCAICNEKNDWRQPNRLLVVQTGESISQAKVFEAHAVPQFLCGNLIDALKLLANQQECGDGLSRKIMTNRGDGSRKGLTNGLRDFIKIDNRRALEVGCLNEGMGKLKV